MRVSLIKNNKIKNFLLPNVVQGNYWITDVDKNGNTHNLINIEASNGAWKIIGNSEVYLVKNNDYVESQVLGNYLFYNLKDVLNNRSLLLYCSPIYEDKLNYYDMTSAVHKEFTVGKNSGCDLVYNFSAVSDICAKITFNDGKIYVTDNGFSYGVFVNNTRVKGTQEVEYGDVIFILGLKFSFVRVDGVLILMTNNPNGLVSCKLMSQNIVVPDDVFKEETDDIEFELYEQGDYFHKKPRFVRSISELKLKVDAPPEKASEDEMPALLTVGPMLTMSMMSMMMMYTAINNGMNSEKGFSSAIPSLVMAVAMLGSTLIWPLITKNYQKRKKKENEALRQEKYGKYIDSKYEKIIMEKKNQGVILNDKFPSLFDCLSVIQNKQVNLWERRLEDEDFLTVSLGYGQLPMQINIQYPEEHFSLASDNLKDMLNKLGSEPKILSNVPIPFSFNENYISGVIGNDSLNYRFVYNTLLQLMSFHSYDDLKIVIFTDEEKESSWDFLKILPHSFSDDRSIRYFASNSDEYKELCYNLDRVLYSRLEASENSNRNMTYNQRYLIITDSFKAVRNYDFIKKILDLKNNLGFSLLIMNDKISTLPDQCQAFINIHEKQSEVLMKTSSEPLKFTMDTVTKYDMYDCAKVLANIPIEIDSDSSGQIPSKLGFLEMFDVGKIEQLNSLVRWQKNTPIQNMQVPVGIGKSGEIISLDLHEKFHGPHGLIAGMTGSGKSEFIITYILSLAVNYHPHEVQFILIDYKGGGLTGAFENETHGVKLPHVIGTITNLDTNEIKRSIASIESEMKRRQKAFNKARELTGESTVDIYKYQKMYREGIVDEPISHLLIIADEFAEMKTQQPEFMEHLISTARIGRSLGVHLILATQKPSGVVDSQIWSNTRFRVCLRVQDKGDSTEVIKCPDAALLKQTGRFYLQVGFNEVFVLGQSAWTGGKYIPSEKIKKNIDTSVSVIDNIGYSIKKYDTHKRQETGVSLGEEITCIVKYLQGIANEQNITCKPLWLDKISNFIQIENLAQKYNYVKRPFDVELIVGEYDVPSQQAQHLLTLPLKDGNTLIYGATGSGKENFITTMIYSSMLYNTVDEVNYYILDFGAEVLKYFDKCPFVGDIVKIDEKEKVNKLFSIINNMIEERKKLFSDYGGDYSFYCQNSGKTVPAIVVVINNYEAYQETYSEYDDLLNIITRDCTKYGIYFVLTITNPNGIRFKLKQNFSQVFALQQNSDDDFSTILGNVRKNYPSKVFGRGIIRKEDVYEFQTALVCERDDISKVLREKINAMDKTKRAPRIPTLPDTLIYDDIRDYVSSSRTFVVGIDKNDLVPVNFDFKKSFTTLISSMDLSTNINFVNSLIYQIQQKNNQSLIVINAEDYDIDNNLKGNLQYIDSRFNDIFDSISKYVDEKYDLYIQNNYERNIFKNERKIMCIIIGIDDFKNKLSNDNKTKFGSIFEKAKDLGLISYIIVDGIDKIKKVEFDPWYKNCVNSSEGIWIGSGINDQFSLKISQKTKDTKEDIDSKLCFVIKKGKPILTKYVEKYSSDNSLEELEI